MEKGKKLIFDNRIRVLRAEYKMTQGKLAKEVNVTRQTISAIENLQFSPSAKLAALICLVFEKKFEEVFYFRIEDDV